MKRNNIEKVVSMDEYKKIYLESIKDTEKFWGNIAEGIYWHKKWRKIREFDFVKAKIKWFEGGKLNACFNCLDRHVKAGNGKEIAIIWEGNESTDNRKLSYEELLKEVKKFANVLKNNGVKRGDRVCIYLQMIPELAIAMLACARIGAIHSVVFGAFSSESLKERINDSSCKILITQDSAVRGIKTDISMKANADDAVKGTPSIERVIVVKRTGQKIKIKKGRDIWWHEEMNDVSEECEPEIMNAEDPLFILYTSGSTGKPKGVLHTTGGYLVYTSFSHKIIFDYRKNDIYWCTADIGWITGHSYVIYGPLTNCASVLMYEGVPNYPNCGRFWEIIEKYKVNIFYTAPTALRSLMKEGNSWPLEHDLSSLRILGTVGETIKEPEWFWYHKIIGKEKCPILDTWWQTETGGILISPIANITPLKPGSATLPFFGIEPVILNEAGKELEGEAQGYLAIKSAWPSMMRTLYGNHKRFIRTYFNKFPGYYLTGDGAKRDKDGYYWIIGRIDDVLNVSGHRIGTAEVEGAIGKTKGIAEAAVVSYPHDIKGEGIYAFVTPMTGQEATKDLEQEVKNSVRKFIGSHAVPDKIQFTSGLPKTRSGKIMRRVLRKIACGEINNLGDISTLAEPGVVEILIKAKI